jgi:hypothetical protein
VALDFLAVLDAQQVAVVAAILELRVAEPDVEKLGRANSAAVLIRLASGLRPSDNSFSASSETTQAATSSA